MTSTWSFTGHMHAVSIATLKAKLSAELRRVKAGETVTVLERTTQIAQLAPLPEAAKVIRPVVRRYEYRTLDPLTTTDPLAFLDARRGDR